MRFELPEIFYEPIEVSINWLRPKPGIGLITVVADDDGQGRSDFFEYNEDDNIHQAKLLTCTPPWPGPF